MTVDEAAREITTYDILVGLRCAAPCVRRQRRGRTGVSIEVDPRRGHREDDRRGAGLWWTVDGGPTCSSRSWPRGPRGCPLSPSALAEGISVNVTLIFSLERHTGRSSTCLYERPGRPRRGRSCRASPRSRPSSSTSRVDTEVDGRLGCSAPSRPCALRGQGGDRQRATWPMNCFRAAVRFSPRWAALSAQGASPAAARCGHVRAPRIRPSSTRCTWSSWSRRGTPFNTMPEATLQATAAHACCTGTRSAAPMRSHGEGVRAAGGPGHQLRRGGGTVLEEQGVQKFATSWNEMPETITREMAAVSGR